MMKSGHPLNNQNDVLRSLVASGYEAYFVGGAVRDHLLGREPKDWDIATTATPNEVRTVFPDADFVGAHFGVSLVKTDVGTVEVATYRTDGAYSDSRRPDSVRFTRSVQEDLQRRDFTINALLMDVDGKVIDHVGGIQDLDAKLIRAIGDAGDRFEEDALRMLRAVRFACQLGFNIERNTRVAITMARLRIKSLSAERIQQELSRILLSGRAATGIRLMESSGILKTILPEIFHLSTLPQNPLHHPEGNVLTHTICLLKQLPKDCSLTLALAVLLHDVGKEPTLGWNIVTGQPNYHGHEDESAKIAERILRDLRYPNDVIETVVNLVAQHMRFSVIEEMKRSKLLRFVRQENFEELLELHRMDAIAGSGNMCHWEYAKRAWEDTPVAVMRPERLVTGDDLIAMGYKPGPQFKDALELVETLQLEGMVETRDQAIDALMDAMRYGVKK